MNDWVNLRRRQEENNKFHMGILYPLQENAQVYCIGNSIAASTSEMLHPPLFLLECGLTVP
jgi:hypothetical protein